MKLRTAVSVFVVTTLGMAASALWLATPAGAELVCTEYVTQTNPATQKVTLICVKWVNTGGSNEEEEEGDPDPGPADDPTCNWEVYPIPDGVTPDRPAGVTPDAVMYWEICVNEFGNTWVRTGAQWWEPNEVPLPSPEQVATEIRLTLVTELHRPALGTDPSQDKPSFVKTPTFVEVTNWPEVPPSERGCDPTGLVCVTLTATPSLTFDPAEEPDVDTIPCEPGGTRFDPNQSGTPLEQAEATGACAHVYEHRTGVEARPDAWPGVVSITWELGWVADSGESDTLDPVVASTDLPRAVDEVQGVVNP
jgi:hypothetical protein